MSGLGSVVAWLGQDRAVSIASDEADRLSDVASVASSWRVTARASRSESDLRPPERWARSVLLWDITSVGRSWLTITGAMLNVLPVPVAPKRV